MRQVILDTETTGLEPSAGHRIIEIGCIEMINRRMTERRYHQYINPERDIDAGAVEVHGLTTEFLSSKPTFAEVAEEFLGFVKDAELVIHNAPFDVGFINAELNLLGESWGTTSNYCKVFDTLTFARELHPGQRNSLDALCRRYEIDNTHRQLHGALLDAELLADVYLAMTGGQVDMMLNPQDRAAGGSATAAPLVTPPSTATGMVVEPSAEEVSAHEAFMTLLEDRSSEGCAWRDLEG